MFSFLKPAFVVLFAALLVACGDSSAPTSSMSGDSKTAAAAAEDAASAVKDAVKSAADSAADAAEDAADAAKDAGSDAVATVAAAAGPDLAAGEQTYGRFCFSCHAAGVAGAPKLGNAEDWAPRVAKGLDALVASTIEGIAPGMPARGLCMNCSDEDLRNTVAWMIAQ